MNALGNEKMKNVLFCALMLGSAALPSAAAAQQSTITQLKKDFQLASAEQQKEIQLLTAQLKEQAAQIQKVSAQVEVSRSSPQVVTDKP